jgi:AraC family L-rhamnose operon regulatory protein RhaS
LHNRSDPNIGPGKRHWLILDVGVRRPNQEWRWPRWLTMTDDDRKELPQKLRLNENPVWNASPDVAVAFKGLSDCIEKWPAPHLESRLLTLLSQLFCVS